MASQDSKSIHFIDETIQVQFIQTPVLEKKPTCPDTFTWDGKTFVIQELLAEWKDYRRRGRMEKNMIPEHASRASQTGSWGVGRFYFRVRTNENRVFDLYYDRSPLDVDSRKGFWVLYCERESPQAPAKTE